MSQRAILQTLYWPLQPHGWATTFLSLKVSRLHVPSPSAVTRSLSETGWQVMSVWSSRGSDKVLYNTSGVNEPACMAQRCDLHDHPLAPLLYLS